MEHDNQSSHKIREVEDWALGMRKEREIASQLRIVCVYLYSTVCAYVQYMERRGKRNESTTKFYVPQCM